MPRKFIVERFPLDVREKIDYFISEGFNPLSIFKWLEENIYPKWCKEGKKEFCVTRKTIYNYAKNRCPENLLVSGSYLREARKRVDSDIDVLGNLQESIEILDKLIKSFDLDNLSSKDKLDIKLILHEYSEMNLKYMDLQVRLGLVKEEKKVETVENILERLKKESDEKRVEENRRREEEEEKALRKVVEP